MIGVEQCSNIMSQVNLNLSITILPALYFDEFDGSQTMTWKSI